MDTNLMEINGIMESFKLDMLTIEQENFMNIMYTRHNGVLNESIIHEGFKDIVKEIVRRAKEAIHKLVEKVKEILAKVVDENKRRIKKYSGNFKNLDDDAEFEGVYEYNGCVEIYNNLKKSEENMKKMIDLVITDKDNLSENKITTSIKILNDKYEDSKDHIDDILPKLVTYTGKDAKTVFKKYDDLGAKFTKFKWVTCDELIKYLKEADKQIDEIGNKYTREFVGDSNFEVNDRSKYNKIETYKYKSKDKNLSKLLNQYIQFFSLCCKMILVYREMSWRAEKNIDKFINQVIKSSGGIEKEK